MRHDAGEQQNHNSVCDMAVAHAAVSSSAASKYICTSTQTRVVNAGRHHQTLCWQQGEEHAAAVLPSREYHHRRRHFFGKLVLHLGSNKNPVRAVGRDGLVLHRRRPKWQQIVAASPPGEELAVRTEPLTKQDLVAYLASGCKPKEKWRFAAVSSLSLKTPFISQQSILNWVLLNLEMITVCGGYMWCCRCLCSLCSV